MGVVGLLGHGAPYRHIGRLLFTNCWLLKNIFKLLSLALRNLKF